MKFFQGSSTQGDITHTFMLNNALIDKNDFGQWHRIATEGQQAVVQNNSTGGVFNWTNNSTHDPIDPRVRTVWRIAPNVLFGLFWLLDQRQSGQL